MRRIDNVIVEVRICNKRAKNLVVLLLREKNFNILLIENVHGNLWRQNDKVNLKAKILYSKYTAVKYKGNTNNLVFSYSKYTGVQF